MNEPLKAGEGFKIAMACLGVVVLCIVLLVGLMAGFKSYSRYQKRADANNAVKVKHIEIRKAKQQAQITYAQVEATRARAKKRIVEAGGIRKAQDKIAATLTPLYVQHEAIQAQKMGAGSGDKTYIPVGPQGVPLVADLSNDNSVEPKK